MPPKWHEEAEKRGLFNLRSTPEALPWLVDKGTVSLFKKYGVLSSASSSRARRSSSSSTRLKLNIEAENGPSMARTQILPPRSANLNGTADGRGSMSPIEEIEPVVKELHFALRALEDANLKDNQDDSSPIKWANYMRDRVVRAMEDVREVADRLEGLIPDDLWPLPKYSEMLFIK